MAKGVVHGDDLLYRFFQGLFESEPDLAHRIAQQMLRAMAIWLPIDLYGEWPVLLPWVVRDPTCRGNPRKGLADAWSAPDAAGYLRDDNSLIKALPRSLPVAGPTKSGLNNARMGSEFVAAHVWRVVADQPLASRLPLLNSFVPNLVWLPGQVAKMTDREGSVVQQTLQAMSMSIYRDAPVASHLQATVEEAWSLLPHPEAPVSVSPADLNWFRTTPRFLATRQSRLNSVIRALETLEIGDTLTAKVIATRYTEGLPSVSTANRAALLDFLRKFSQPD